MGGYGIAYVLIGGSHKCRHIADRGGEEVKKGQKTAYILKKLKEHPLGVSALVASFHWGDKQNRTRFILVFGIFSIHF